MGKRKPMKMLTSAQSYQAEVIDKYLTDQFVIVVIDAKGLGTARVYGCEVDVLKKQLHRTEEWKNVHGIDWAALGFLMRGAKTPSGKKAIIITRQERVLSQREVERLERTARRNMK